MDAAVDVVGQYVTRAIQSSGISGVDVGLSFSGQTFLLHDGRPCLGSKCQTCLEGTFPVSCLARPLLALACHRLSEAGDLELDSPLKPLLPELSGPAGRLSCTHLLTHTLGIRGTLSREILIPGWSPARLVDFVNSSPQHFAPGTVFNHETLSSGLLGELLQRASGRPCLSLLEEVLAGLIGGDRSLGGTSDYSRELAKGLPGSVGPAWLRPIRTIDLIAVCNAFIDQGSAATHSSASDQSKKALFDPAISLPRGDSLAVDDHLPVGFSRGLAIFNRGLVGYDGSLGAKAIGFRLHAGRGISAVVGVREGGQVYRRHLLAGVVSCLALPARAPHALIRSEIDIHEIQGRYLGNDDTEVVVSTDSAAVTLHIRGDGDIQVALEGQLSDDGTVTFTSRSALDAPIFFRARDSGSVSLMLGLCAFKKH